MADNNQCWGYYDDTSQTGWGPAYQYACIHSDETTHSGGNTVWYNYTLATAGTIIDENTDSEHPVTNTNTATESICPKGWTLPNKTQIDAQRNIASFSPVLGGYYWDGTLHSEDTLGYWWGSTAYNGATRYYLGYNVSSLYTSIGFRRRDGLYVRCVQAS